MDARSPRNQRTAWALLASGLLGTAGCSGSGQIAYSNDASTTVTVQLAEEDLGDVTSGGGGVIHTDDCLDGPVHVTCEGGGVIELAGPVCPGQQLLIRDETARLAQLDGTG
ncbi:hypothetical protein MO973_10570 [Paenibacillus sp. TRM 82003]|uniref:hypothetical protein n=1 Tax=Kineococcus sp. TRM81007 TaxID=2925831 RepID=UPI001F5A6B57|nr:hypothetical protein [Kineococcus sp. TRM81007]MCI2239218.1 hypothetical protein [Kineococcus sp. TRM81007]MCI3920677.1 hypothetical protein [Paenibacillus sp. TRM 82003]